MPEFPAGDALYGVDPDAFVAARTAAFGEARRAGDRPLAARLAALKRPTRSAWLVNLLVRDRPEAVAELGALADGLVAAHATGDPAAVRSLGGDRARLVERLTRASLALGEGAGYRGGEPVRAEVAGTLLAAIADPEALAAVATARLAKPLTYAGFGPWVAPLALVPDPAPDEEPPGPVAPAAEEVPRLALVRARARLADAETAAAGAGRELADAEAAATEAGERLDRSSQEVADLAAELRAAERAEAAARDAHSAEAAKLGRARDVRERADKELAAARAELADLGG